METAWWLVAAQLLLACAGSAAGWWLAREHQRTRTLDRVVTRLDDEYGDRIRGALSRTADLLRAGRDG